MKKSYRISHWRSDVPRSTYSIPSFEGSSVEECDEKALKHFDVVSNIEGNEWEGMDLYRIDTPAVGEKTTFLIKNGRQESDND